MKKLLIIALMFFSIGATASTVAQNGTFIVEDSDSNFACLTAGVLWRHNDNFDQIVDAAYAEISFAENGDLLLNSEGSVLTFWAPTRDGQEYYLLYLGKKRSLKLYPTEDGYELIYSKGPKCRYSSGLIRK